MRYGRISPAFLWCAWLWSATAGAAPLATVDRSVIAETETLTLSIETPEQSSEPDWAPLEKDFEVVNSARNSQVSIVNGKVEARNEWRLLLAPRHAGEITIPALNLGTAHSDPIKIKVVSGGTRPDTAGGGQAVSLEASVEPSSVYVQGQLIYTVRLFHAVDLKEGSLSTPTVHDAIVERLGDDKTYEVQREGRRVRVIERRYAIFPQSHGHLKIPPVEFNGQVATRSAAPFGGIFGRDPFDQLFDRGTPVRVRTKELAVEVKPQPGDVRVPWWLPAERLKLSEAWTPDPPVFRVGEPVTRTIVIEAQGLTAQQLPELGGTDVAGFKTYPDQAAHNNQTTAQGITGKKEQKVVWVATQPGKLTLPELQLAWWNTSAGKLELATLPARTVDVLPGLVANAPPPTMPAPASTPVVTSAPLSSSPDPDARPHADASLDIWRWLALALFAAWAVTGLAWWWHARGRRAASVPPREMPVADGAGIKAARDALRRACAGGDPVMVRDALLVWARSCWPNDPPLSLGALGARLHDATAKLALSHLESALYAATKAPWNAKPFWETFTPVMNRENGRELAPKKDDALPLLYPTTGSS